MVSGGAILSGMTISTEANDFFPDKTYFERTVSGLGGESATIGLAGLTIRFTGLTADLITRIDSVYAPFLTLEQPQHSALVCEGSGQYLTLDSGMIRLRERMFDGGGMSLVSNDFAAYRNGGSGKLFVSNPADLVQTTRALENYMRWVMAELAVDQGGFILHSAGLVRDGNAYLFFGPSGAGKSTVAGLSNLPVLSDDLVVVKGDGSTFSAHTTPFHGVYPQLYKHKTGYPVGGAFYLHKSDRVNAALVPMPEAIGLIVSMCPFLTGSPRRLHKLLAIAERFCESVPVSRLYFRKDASFWERIQ